MSPVKVKELWFNNHLPPLRRKWSKCKIRSPAHLTNMDETPARGWPLTRGLGPKHWAALEDVRLHAVGREGKKQHASDAKLHGETWDR